MSLELRRSGRLTVRTRLRLAVEIARTYARVRWLLGRRDLPATVEALRAAPSPSALGGDPVENGRRLGRAVQRTLEHLPGDSRCLVQSLVLLGVLARRRIPATLVIGVVGDADFAAHAWLEHGEAPLLTPGSAFEQLVRL